MRRITYLAKNVALSSGVAIRHGEIYDEQV
jgi:hypothetical protein